MFKFAIASITIGVIVSFASLKALNLLYFSRIAHRIPEGIFGPAFLLPAALGLAAGFWLPTLLFKNGTANRGVRVISAIAGCLLAYWVAITTTPP